MNTSEDEVVLRKVPADWYQSMAEAAFLYAGTVAWLNIDRRLLIGIVAPMLLFGVGHSCVAQEKMADWLQRQTKIKRVIEQASPSVVAIGGGTGLIVTSQGHVLTVSHVAGKTGRRIRVQLSDGSQSTATTLGSDPESDTAVMKLDDNGPWPVLKVRGLSVEKGAYEHSAKMGRDSGRAIGDWCLAFGYPLSFERGASAVVRLGRVTAVASDRLTASTTIMGGDSGGPLLDLDGRLIGIASRVKADIGANLFVPVETCRQYWSQLLVGGEVASGKDLVGADIVTRPWLGIFGDTDETLVRLRKVQPGSPAATAGLRAEDVVLSFNGVSVSAFSDVVKILKTMRPQDVVAVRVNRFGQPLDMRVTLGVRP